MTREELLRLAGEEGTALLWSGGELDSARNSFLFCRPVEEVRAESWEELQALIEPLKPNDLWAGYLGYEMGATADRDRSVPRHPAPTPDALFYRYEAVTNLGPNPDLPLYKRPIRLTPKKSGLEPRDHYTSKVERVLEEIRAGEIYQMCLSHEYELEGEADPFSLFLDVIERNPSPFAAYLNCGEFQIVSSSPERFLMRDGNQLETRPIKGTMPRGKTPEQDERHRAALLCSDKERAELMMITDLMRNDLGRFSVPGSVRADEVWRVEAYTNVFHLLSIVRSQLSPGISSLEVLRQAFPGGSISGCPKLRAMEIIAELEQRARGVYTGAIGYFWGPDRFDFNIAIRTLVCFPDRLNVQLGGAIVADSDPDREYEETLHKGETLFKGLGVDVCLV